MCDRGNCYLSDDECTASEPYWDEPEYPVRRLLITGSRDWTDNNAISRALFDYWYRADKPSDLVLVHGGANGADLMAASCWGWNNLPVEAYPADWEGLGRRAGIVRNLQMLDLEPEHVLAFIKNNSRGATHCAAEAERRGIPVTYYREDDLPNRED